MNRPVSIYIGNQTAFSAANMLEPWEYALSRHFDAFEWFPDKKPWGAGWDDLDLNCRLRTDIKNTAKACNMRLSVHGRWTINPARDNGEAASLSREIELAEALGASIVVVHLYTDSGIAAYATAILPALRLAAAKGLKLAIENTVMTTPEDFNQLFSILSALSLKELAHVGMCLDIGHANLCAATRNDYLGYIDRLSPAVPIIHLHIHENWGDADSHLPLFTGPAARDTAAVRGFLTRMKQRGFSGSLIFEQWPQPPTLLDQARETLLELWRDAPTELPNHAVGLAGLASSRALSLAKENEVL